MRLAPKPATITKKPAEQDEKVREKMVGLASVAEKVAKKTRYAKKNVAEIVRATMEVIAAEITKGNAVRLNGLGTLYVVDRPARNVVAFGKPMVVPARRKVKFRPHGELKQKLQK